MTRSLDQWVEYIQSLHHREIELSLERVRDVYLRMYPNGLACQIVSIAGTNGKGSTAELISSIYRQAGFNVGKFTSPHLIDFSERFNLNGAPVGEQYLLESFRRVEMHRSETPITFFEYCTLLALDLFATNQVDIAVLEVGLGGRLDSVNIVDADVSIVTSISIDHADWLGNTIEKIAFEKVGIARSGKPLLIGIENPPKSMLTYANKIDANVKFIGRDFYYQHDKLDDYWEWLSGDSVVSNLPMPYGQDGVQLSNCSLALEVVKALSLDLPVIEKDIRNGIRDASIFGRCQVIRRNPTIILDVAHNEASVARLAEFLLADDQHALVEKRTTGPGRRIVAVCGMLRDKDATKSLDQISHIIDEWHLATIHTERGSSASELARKISFNKNVNVVQHEYVENAYDAAFKTLTTGDCLVVFGSFHIVGDILSYIK